VAEEFTLLLEVKGQPEIIQLTGLVSALSSAGTTAERKLGDAARQADAIKKGFASLSAQFKSSFEQLSASVNNLGTALEGLGQKTSRAGQGAKTPLKAVKEEAEQATKTVRTLKSEIQKAYEQSLIGQDKGIGRGRSPTLGADLRLLRDYGVQLSPEDQGRLKRYEAHARARDEHLKRLEADYQRERALEVAHSQALAENAARTQILGKLQAAAQLEDANLIRKAGVTQAQALEDASQMRRRILEADLRFTKLAKQSAMDLRQFNMAKGAKEALAAGLPLSQVEQRFGSLAVAAARSNTEFARLQTAAIAALEATASRVDKARSGIKGLTSDTERAQTAFDRLTAKQRLQRAEQAAALLTKPDGEARALRSFGPQIVGLAQSADEMTRLRQSVSGLHPELFRHGQGVGKVGEGYQALHTGLRGVAGSMGAIWLTWGRPLATLWAGFASASVVKQATLLFVEYENQLRIIEAVAGATTAEIESLNKAIAEQAKGGKYSRLELAQSARVLAQAGLSVPTVETALPTVSRFATVGEMPLDKAGQSLVGIASAFGESTTNLTKVSDTIAKAAAISQTSIEAMTAAVRVSSVVAEQFGASIAEVSTILAVLAKRNIEASAAGTALRNAYTELYTPTEKAKRAMDALKLSAYDSEGNRKPFLQTMLEMREQLERFTPKSQDAFFTTFFGERGAKAASALLSDLKGLQEASEKVEKSAGFVDDASLKIESSLKNRAVAALNTFRGALIDAGKAAEGPMSAVISQLQRLAASEELAEALKTVAITMANFTLAVTKASGVLAVFFGLYLGSKTIGLFTGLVAAITSVTGAYGLKTIAVTAATLAMRGQAVTLASLATALTTVATGAGAATTTVTTLSGALGLLSTALSRGFPKLLLIAGAVWGLTTAFNALWNAKNKALETAPETTEAGIAQLEKRAAEARKDFDTRYSRIMLGTKPEQEESSFADKLIKEVENRRDADLANAMRAEERANTNSKREAREALYTRIKTEAQAQIDRINAARDALNTIRPGMRSLDVVEREQQERGLSSGKEVFDPSDGSRSYPSPLGTELSSDRAAAQARFEAAKRGFEREEKYIELYRRNQLIDEETYTADLQNLAERRAKILVEEAEAAYKDLDRQEAKRREDILARVKDPKDRAQHFDAMRSEYNKLRQAGRIQIEEARENAQLVVDQGVANAIGRAKAKEDALEALIAAQESKLNEKSADWMRSVEDLEGGFNLSQRLREAKDGLNPLRELQRQYREDELRINEAYDKKLREARQSLNEDWVREVEDSAARTAAALRQLYDTLQASRGSEVGGIRNAAVKMLDEIENRAAAVGNVFTNAFNSAEEAFVDFVRTGKFSMKSLVQSIIADLARLSFQQAVKGPMLASILQGLGGSGIAAAATFHAGGMVGAGGSMGSVNPSWFVGAQKMHSGGPVLAADEVPIIARKGETVLTPEQSRSINNDSSVVVNNNVTVNGGASKADILNAMEAARRSTILSIQDAQRRGRRRM
jgi:TP901 family phage tail tape measure protein